MAVPETQSAVFESWTFTKMREVRLTHTWVIDQFALRPEQTGEPMTSCTFAAGPDDQRQWCLQIFPRGERKEYEDYVSLNLSLVSSGDSRVWTTYSLALLDAGGEKYKETTATGEFKQGETWGYSDFIRRDVLLNEDHNVLTGGKLTVCCDVAVVEDSVNISKQSDKVETDPWSRLSDDLGTILNDVRFADVFFCVGDLKVPAHKNILSARSPIFADMFWQGTKERKNKKMEIKDFTNLKVLLEMLRFIYTGKVQNMDNIRPGSLFEVAKKYELKDLQVICEDELCASLSIGRAADYLILADSLGAGRLKAHAIAFINRHPAVVKKTGGWKTLITCHPRLVAEAWMNLTSSPSSLSNVPLGEEEEEEETKRRESRPGSMKSTNPRSDRGTLESGTWRITKNNSTFF